MELEAFCAPFLLSHPRRTTSFSCRYSRWVISTSPFARVRVSARRRTRAIVVAADSSLQLPTELDRLVDAFASVPDNKLRYQQLLFFAKNLPPMDPDLKTEANRVRGCTSVVHVHVELDEHMKVHIIADSDAQLTKGLVALLVNGLSGCTIEQVLAVDPSFIVASGLSVSLTPSRNNGFINMVSKIKEKVIALRDGRSMNLNIDSLPRDDVSSSTEGNQDDLPNRPLYSAILRKLRAINPAELDVQDTSYLHEGHAGMSATATPGKPRESHFIIRIVSNAFKDLNLVKRHRLIYKLLQDEMKQAHAFNIEAWTVEEAASKQRS